MKTITLFFALVATLSLSAQPYLGMGIGYAIHAKSPLMHLTLGYKAQPNIIKNDVLSVGYSQRVLNRRNPTYLGGNIAYGITVVDYLTLEGVCGTSYRLLSSDTKRGNYWIPSYGIRMTWKKAVLELNKTEFWQASIGCVYTFN